MQKYIDMFHNLPNWIPFIGLATGSANKSPLATRLLETSILAFIPIISGSVWLIPKMEAKLDSNTQILELQAAQYTAAQMETSQKIKDINQIVRKLEIDNAVIQESLSEVKSKVDNIDDVANTKVRSVEGRLDSLEHRIK